MCFKAIRISTKMRAFIPSGKLSPTLHIEKFRRETSTVVSVINSRPTDDQFITHSVELCLRVRLEQLRLVFTRCFLQLSPSCCKGPAIRRNVNVSLCLSRHPTTDGRTDYRTVFFRSADNDACWLCRARRSARHAGGPTAG